MQIVINVRENFLYEIKHKHPNMRNELEQSVLDGTILPKGHGKLKDVDALYEDLIFPNEQFGKTFKDILDDAPTIIKADREGEIYAD